MSFFTWPAENSMPGTAKTWLMPWSRSLSRPSRMMGLANSRNPYSTVYSGKRAAREDCRDANSSTARTSRLPWPQIITPVLFISDPGGNSHYLHKLYSTGWHAESAIGLAMTSLRVGNRPELAFLLYLTRSLPLDRTDPWKLPDFCPFSCSRSCSML